MSRTKELQMISTVPLTHDSHVNIEHILQIQLIASYQHNMINHLPGNHDLCEKWHNKDQQPEHRKLQSQYKRGINNVNKFVCAIRYDKKQKS